MRAWLISVPFLFSAAATHAEELKNWFNDPFFQVRRALPACPAPLGPLLPESKRNAEAHYRVERGNSCYLVGKCRLSNSYLYDPEIARAVEKAFADSPGFADTSLWITVQRRFVMVEGCVAHADDGKRLEALIEPLPDVERVIVEVSKPGDVKPPYALAP